MRRAAPVAAAAFAAALALAALPGCASTSPREGDGEAPRTTSLSRGLADIARAFLIEADAEAVTARARYALFVPEDGVHPRHRQAFRGALERGLTEGGTGSTLVLASAAERVLVLSEIDQPGWSHPDGVPAEADVLLREVRNGTPLGWTALHAFWSQYNRLMIGDDAFIQSLPDSVRGDLSHPLRYVLRASVHLAHSPSAIEHVHDVTLQLVEAGSERPVLSRTYPLRLTHAVGL